MSDFLKILAPSLGTAFDGPLKGIAATFLENKLNEDVSTVLDAINNETVSVPQIENIKSAEVEFLDFCKTNKINVGTIGAKPEAIDAAFDSRSWVQSTLAILITIGYLGILTGAMLGGLQLADNQALLILVGALSTGFGTVLNFFMGSSHGSSQKTALLAKADALK